MCFFGKEGENRLGHMTCCKGSVAELSGSVSVRQGNYRINMLSQVVDSSLTCGRSITRVTQAHLRQCHSHSALCTPYNEQQLEGAETSVNNKKSGVEGMRERCVE